MDSTLLIGNALELLKKVSSKSIDLVLTDPPYDIRKYSTGNIFLPGRKPLNNDIAEWDGAIPINEYAKEFKRLLKPKGNIFIFTSYNLFGKWHQELDDAFDTCQFMIWHKINPTPRIYKNSFLNSCEMIICTWNRGHTWNFSNQMEMHNFFESKICMYPERLDHPTQKPVSIIKHIIKIASRPNDLVLDCFAGTGTTGVACQLLNRRYLLIENNKYYYEMAKNRLEKMKTMLNSNNKIEDLRK